MSQRYAVLEWAGSYEDGDGWASVVSTDDNKEHAEMMVRITPNGYTRVIVTMAEYEESLQLSREDLPS